MLISERINSYEIMETSSFIKILCNFTFTCYKELNKNEMIFYHDSQQAKRSRERNSRESYANVVWENGTHEHKSQR